MTDPVDRPKGPTADARRSDPTSGELTSESASEEIHRLTLPSPRRTDGAAKVRYLACNAIYYGFARYLPFSARPYALGARWIRYHVCRHMFRSCGTNVNVERGALINSGADIDIGDNSGIGLDAYILGPLVIGRDVTMGPRCTIIAVNHSTSRTDIPIIQQGFEPELTPVIEDDVWIGANVTILPGRRIGTGSIVAAGTVVTRDVPPFTVVGGNPVRIISRRT